MTTPTPSRQNSTRQVPPTSFRNPEPSSSTLNQPIDTSFLRLSVTSTTPSERLSTWSFHPSEPPGSVSGSGAGSGTGSSGVGGRSSVGTFGPSSPPHNDVDSLGRKKQPTPDEGDDGVGKGKGIADDISPIELKEDRISRLPGTVQKYNRASQRSNTPPTDKQQHVHFGHKSSQSTDQGYPSILRHRPAASTSLLETITSTGTGISQSPSTLVGARTRTRSKSIDSISLHPSIADSATDLLNPSHGLGGRLPLVLAHSSNIPRDLVARNDLPPDQRAVLLRRAKKLEQLLGQSLDERSIERLLIDPIHAHRTITTRSKLAEEAWPDSPTRAGREEWQRDDCLPRKGKVVDVAPATTTQHVGLGLARSGSFLARTARAALGLSKTGAGDRQKGDLAVYVSREIRVSATGGRPVARHSASTPAELGLRRETTSPVSPMLEREEGGSESDEGEDEVARRIRRLQLAKLHRLLGVPIPPDLVQRHSSGTDRESTETSTSAEHSFMLMEDNIVTPSPSWTAMLKNTLSLVRSREGKNKRSSSPVPNSGPRSVSRSDSYVDMAIGGGGTMNEREKAVARKKAQKLEYMFGDTPPRNMFLPARSVTPDQSIDPIATSSSIASQQSLRTRQTSHGSFVAYQQSLTNLLYLVDNDTATLDILMDKIDQDSDPEQEEARQRRKRTGKLTHFFGETGIDFDDPPNVESTMERVRSRTNTLRKDTLDEMMREMWRGVQAEVKRGGMAVKDGERLGEMIDKLRIRRGRQGRGQWEVL